MPLTLTFVSRRGQIYVLLGHNGAGKTTTISMLTGLITPTSGSMNIFGRDVSTQLSEVRSDLGVCPQHNVLWPELTVYEHLRIFADIKGVPIEKRHNEIMKAIADVGLTEKVNVQTERLSGGQKRKLSVCIALVGGSRVIFLDEPTSGMDPYSRRSTWQILQNAREGRVMVLTTHFMDEADILGDRICIMADGGESRPRAFRVIVCVATERSPFLFPLFAFQGSSAAGRRPSSRSVSASAIS